MLSDSPQHPHTGRRRFLDNLGLLGLGLLSALMSFSPAALAATSSKTRKTKRAQKTGKSSKTRRATTRTSTKPRVRTRTQAAKPAQPERPGRRLASDPRSEKTISLVVPQTGEKLIQVPFWTNGSYLPDAMIEIAHLMRDMRSGEVRPVDPGLLDLLYDLGQTLETASPFQIVCGYRSPSTNAILRAHSARVARHSLHMEGRAIDIRLDRGGANNLRRAALALERGGVGYYPGAGFVHVDTGPVRTWRG
jgi:uncharacterized protein YcbK (DUF882 family)